MPPSTSPAFGLLMDLDGTIADTLPHLFESFRFAVQPFVNRLPTDAEIIATFGPPEHVCIAKLLPQNEPAILRQAVERYHEHYEGNHEVVKAFPGIQEAIQFAVENGWKFGVCTGKGQRSARFTLEQLKLWDQVECLITGDDVKRPKPDPEGVYQALRKWGIPAERLLVVGDAPADIYAGKSAGAYTAAALWGAFDGAATCLAGPTWALTSAFELLAVMEKLCADSSLRSFTPSAFNS